MKDSRRVKQFSVCVCMCVNVGVGTYVGGWGYRLKDGGWAQRLAVWKTCCYGGYQGMVAVMKLIL